MDIEDTRKQKMIIKRVKEFIRKEIAPLAEDMDRKAFHLGF